MHCMYADKAYREETRRELCNNATSYTEQTLQATSYEIAVVRPPTSYLKTHANNPNKACVTLLEKQGRAH